MNQLIFECQRGSWVHLTALCLPFLEVWACLWVSSWSQTGSRRLLPQKQQRVWWNGTSVQRWQSSSIQSLQNDFTACAFCLRLKEEDNICVSTDGPWENVVKFKPPMCFSMEDAELVVRCIDRILTGQLHKDAAVYSPYQKMVHRYTDHLQIHWLDRIPQITKV